MKNMRLLAICAVGVLAMSVTTVQAARVEFYAMNSNGTPARSYKDHITGATIGQVDTYSKFFSSKPYSSAEESGFVCNHKWKVWYSLKMKRSFFSMLSSGYRVKLTNKDTGKTCIVNSPK